MSEDLRRAVAKALGRTHVPQPGPWTHPRCPNWSIGEHLLAMEARCDLCAPAGCCDACKEGDHSAHAPNGRCAHPEPHSSIPESCPCPNDQDPERYLELMGTDMRAVIRELRASYAEQLNESARGTGSIFDPSVLERPFDQNSTQGTPLGLATQGT